MTEVGNDAIALSSTTNVDKFLKWLKENNVKPKKSLIIDLDDDDAGSLQIATQKQDVLYISLEMCERLTAIEVDYFLKNYLKWTKKIKLL